MTAIGYFAALMVGLALGLLGGGGSILTIPILVYLFRIPASLATSYSLFVVGITSLVGTIGYLFSGLVQFRIGAFFLFPSMAGVWLSRRVLLPAIPHTLFHTAGFELSKDRLILLVFALVMGLASFSMLKGRRERTKDEPVLSRSEMARISFYGLMAGCLMGFVGAGGGFLIIPVLVVLGKMDMTIAVGTSLFIITVSSLSGFAGDFFNGLPMDWSFLGLFSGLSISGVFIGTRLSKKIPSQKLKAAFGVMVLVVGLLIIIKELFFQN